VDVDTRLERARQAHRHRRWGDATDAFTEIDRTRPLDVDDLERLAEALDLVGRGDDAIAVLRRVYVARIEAGDVGAALRDAFWLYRALAFNAEFVQAGAWVARAARLMEGRPDCAQQGYLLLPEAERELRDGDHRAAFATARRAASQAARCGERDVVAIAVHLQGRALIGEGRLDEGLVLLDEAMLNIVDGETSPRVTAWIYCKTIQTCHQVYDVRRAREWTLALNAWCDSLEQFTGAYSGTCRIHRSELLQLTGAWTEAAQEAQLACRQLSRGYGLIVTGGAFYQLAEIHRLHGDLDRAEQAYRQAASYGWQVEPGLALLRLARCDTTAAAAAIRRALAESTDRPLYRVPGRELTRSQVLPAYVEIMLAGGDLPAADRGATELAVIAEQYRTPALYARAAHALGSVHLGGNAPDQALPALRRAHRLWQDLGAPYEVARVRVLIAKACRLMRDEDGATRELAAARHAFHLLGARPDVLRADALVRDRPADGACGLSRRELQVLGLLATGCSNRTIATELVLSEKTVHRHVSNIFTKLGVGSRTAAVAYAFEHGISGARSGSAGSGR
jgi:ATP/maltotriose-dependent transcriptional regulator MalT